MKLCRDYTEGSDCSKSWFYIVDQYNWQEPKQLIVVHKRVWNSSLRDYVNRYALDGVFEYEARRGFLWHEKCVKTRRLRFYENSSHQWTCFASKPVCCGKEWFQDKEDLLQTYKEWHEDTFERPEIVNENELIW